MFIGQIIEFEMHLSEGELSHMQGHRKWDTLNYTFAFVSFTRTFHFHLFIKR